MRLLLRSIAAALAWGLVGLVCASACSDPTPQPPALGGCPGIPDASCSPFVGGGGAGGGPPPPEGDSSAVTDAGAAPTDAVVSCGAADTMFGATPNCAACISASSVDGSPSCCASDAACSNDSLCLGLVMCVINCQGGGCLAAQACTMLTPASSISTFNVFAQCVDLACAGVCPSLPMLASGN